MGDSDTFTLKLPAAARSLSIPRLLLFYVCHYTRNRSAVTVAITLKRFFSYSCSYSCNYFSSYYYPRAPTVTLNPGWAQPRRAERSQARHGPPRLTKHKGTKPNQTKPSTSKPSQTEPNQGKPNTGPSVGFNQKPTLCLAQHCHPERAIDLVKPIVDKARQTEPCQSKPNRAKPRQAKS